MDYLSANDKALIEGYNKNISDNYAVDETECEIRAGQTSAQFEGMNNQITLPKFRKINSFYTKLINSDNFQIEKLEEVPPTLDITFQKKSGNLNPSNNLRFSLVGRSAITLYCSTNKIPFSINPKDGKVELIYRDVFKWESDTSQNETFKKMEEAGYKPVKLPGGKISANIDISSIRTRIGGKVELEYDIKQREFKVSSLESDYLRNLKQIATEAYRSVNVNETYKFFRFKKRTSYKINYKGTEFRIDLTTVKSSKMGYGNRPMAFKKFIDAEVAEQPETYEYEIEFEKNKSSENLIGFINNIYIPSFIETNIHPSYTILSKQEKVINLYKNVIVRLLSERLNNKINKIVKAIEYKTSEEQDSIDAQYPNKFDYFHLIKDKSIQELNKSKLKYEKMITDGETKSGIFRVDNNYFISPKVVSIELNNIREDTPKNSIHTNYTVTDKADGYSMLLIKFGQDDTDDQNFLDRMFLIDQNLRVYDTGIKSSKSGTYLFNGEYLEHDITKKDRLNKYGIFDCYIYDNRDVCELPLKSNNVSIETRLSLTESLLKDNYISEIKDESFGIFLKRFNIISPSKNIYACAVDIWKDYEARKINPDVGKEYYLDGMIFTHAEYPVGYNPENPEFDLKQNNTWTSNLKWKPPEDNTIDFLIKFQQDEVLKQGSRVITTNKIKRVLKEVGGVSSYDTYIVANLYSGGYLENKNPCFSSKTTQNRVLRPVAFKPSTPSIEKISEILLPCSEDVISRKTFTYDEEGNIIDNDTIVEVSYTNFDETKDDYIPNPNMRWKVLRTRHDKTYSYKNGVHNQKSAFNLLKKGMQIVNSKQDGDLNPYDLRTLSNVIKIVSHIPGFKRNQQRGPFIEIRDNKSLIEEHYSSYEDIRQSGINFGNHHDIANKIWRTIYNPVTQEMITTGNNIPSISEEEQKYYNRDVKRDKSISLSMQDFHNKIIKNRILLGSVTNELKKTNDSISLLDLACGKGGDIAKWRDNNIDVCVGVDYMSNNIDDKQDGACARNNFYKNQAIEQGKSFPTSYFIVGDVSKPMKDNKFITNAEYSTLANNLWLPNDTLSTNFKINKFNIVSVMFALHYFFRSETVLDQFIENVASNVKQGGYFIGCCFDGKKIFEKLSDVPKGGSVDKFKNGRLMWKIIRNYRQTQFKDDESSVGMSIKVYISSINQIIEEFLVNFEYLKVKLAKYNIVPVTGEELKELNIGNTNQESIGSFKDVFESQSNNPVVSKIISSIKLSSQEKDLSYMFNYFIFKRKTVGEEVLGNIIDIMLSEKFASKLSKKAQHNKIINDSIFADFDKELVVKAIGKAKIIYAKRLKREKEAKKKQVETTSLVSEETQLTDESKSQEVLEESKSELTGAEKAISETETQVTTDESKSATSKAAPLKIKKVATKKKISKVKSKVDPKSTKKIANLEKNVESMIALFRKAGVEKEFKDQLYSAFIKKVEDIELTLPNDPRVIKLKQTIDEEYRKL